MRRGGGEGKRERRLGDGVGEELVFEVGTEEIPSTYMPGMIAALKERAEASLTEARLDFEGLETFGTPRRLVLRVTELADRQKPLQEEILGPPVKNAFDADGNPTRAALGFARTNGAEVSDLREVDTPKGARLTYFREDEGEETKVVLGPLLTKIIRDLPSPKSMRWGDGNFAFVRPVQWILALYGRERVNGPASDEEGSLPSFGSSTYGHRFHKNNKFNINGFQEYIDVLRENYVEPLVDDGAGGGRIPMVRAGVLEAAASRSGEPAADAEAVERLIEKVAHLVEYPFAVACGFDEKFLDLPREVIISTLEAHQRCFALKEKGGGRLIPSFVGVSNTRARDMGVVRKGYERVVRARLEDADFYWRQDLETPLADMAEALKGVVYHPRLGASWDKVARFRRLAAWLCERIAPGDAALAKTVDEAAALCKADLCSGMVYEFPELQGVMGRRYAEREGRDETVCRAIYEHYLPRGEGDDLPEGRAGAIVGLADRMDTIAGMAGLNCLPSGSEDPYALRRAANSILLILEDKDFRISLPGWAEAATEPLKEKFGKDGAGVSKRISGFLRSRVSAHLSRGGARGDLVEAALAAAGDSGWHDVMESRARLLALERLAASEETFEPLATTFKRVSNIVRRAKGERRAAARVDEALLSDDAEIRLNASLGAVSGAVREALAKARGDAASMEEAYVSATSLIAEIRPVVDDFFDKVMVMAEDDALRENRLALLAGVGALFSAVADFTKIQGRASK